jgi:filamin
MLSGDHSVEVKLAGVHVEGSPFLIKAYDAAKVKVTDINSGVVGKPVFFSSRYNIYIYFSLYKDY